MTLNRTLIAAGAALLLASWGAGAQNDFSDVEVTATHAAGNVYILTGSGGNIGVSVGEDGVLMVDDQYAELSGKIQAAIDELGGGAPRFILNTHVHGDHTGGNAEFSDNGTIIAHENVRMRMTSPDSGRSPDAFPVITYEDAVSVHINGEEVIARHYPNPAHTDGDSVIHFTGSNVVHMGDQFFAIRFPFVDLENGGSVQGYVSNIKAIQEDLPEDVTIIPGHGQLTDAEGFAEFVDGVTETVSIVTNRINEGMSLDEIIAEGLPAEYDEWGEGFIDTETWITTIYNSRMQQ